MDEKLNNISDIVHHVVDRRRVNTFESSDLVVITDRSTSDNFFDTTTRDRGFYELRNNSDRKTTHQSKSIKLIPNDREIPDFLEQNDDEDFHILSGDDSILLCSRSTQTRVSDIKNEPKILQTCDFNYPATILNDGTTRKISTPNPFHRETMLMRSQLNSVYYNYQTLKTHFHKLYADYHKLMGVAAELTASLESSERGEPVDIRTTLQACMKIYPDIFTQNVHDDDKTKSSSSECKMDFLDKNLKISMLSTVPLSAKDLNYKKIKLHLINGNIRTKLLLLQALRWKITLSQPGERDETLIEYIHNDLLGLYGRIAGDSGKSILPYILIPLDVVSPHPVQQSAARLLNTFASFKCGRDYLAVGPNILNVITQCLDSINAESIDAFTCDMILATLQKLSLRKHQRLFMISAGMTEWLIHHLKAECHSMGTYRLEYATALLMNLSLHKEAQIRAAAIATMLMSTLIALLSLEHLPALTYVYGALNNFLGNSAINEEANMIGFKSILDYHRNYRSGELRKHLDHILLRHTRKFNHVIEEDINDDDDREENDIVEDELDEMDPVKVQAGDLFGEALLATCYSVSPNFMSRNKNDFAICSSSDITYKTDDKFNPAHNEREQILKDHYLSYHRQKLSPRLTPINYKPKFQNPIRLNIPTRFEVDKTSNEKCDDRIIIDENECKLKLSGIRHRADKIFTDISSAIMLDQLYFPSNHDKNFEEKVNGSSITSQAENEILLSMKSKQIKMSDTNSWTPWDMSLVETENTKQLKNSYSKQFLLHELKNRNESTAYIYENKKSEESRMTAVNSGMNASTVIDSAFDGADVVEGRVSSIASLDITVNEESNHQAVTELTGEEEDAFAAKPRISRTPPQTVSPRGYYDCTETQK